MHRLTARITRRAPIAIFVLCLALSGCDSDDAAPAAGSDVASGGSDTTGGTGGPGALTLTSPAVQDGRLLDEFMCEHKDDGVEPSIPLAWSNVPATAQSLAVSMTHYPNPDDRSHPNVYLLLWGIDPSVTEIPHGAADDGPWFLGSSKDGDAISYTSPCSHSTGTHEYTLTLYALSAVPPSLPAASSLEVTWEVFSAAIDTVTVVDTATLTFDAVTE